MPTQNPFLYGQQPIPGGGTAVLDLPGVATPGINPSAPGPELHGNAPISLSNFFTNPNTYRVAGEIAQGIPNNGIGTALGAVGSKAIGAIQQQKALEKAELERQQRNRALIEALGGYTPPGTPGVTGLTVGKNGELKLTLDPSTGDISPSEELPAISPTPSPASAVYPTTGAPGAPAVVAGGFDPNRARAAADAINKKYPGTVGHSVLPGEIAGSTDTRSDRRTITNPGSVVDSMNKGASISELLPFLRRLA